MHRMYRMQWNLFICNIPLHLLNLALNEFVQFLIGGRRVMHAVRCGETILGQVGIAVEIFASKGALQLLIKCFDLGVFHPVSIGRRRALIDRIYGQIIKFGLGIFLLQGFLSRGLVRNGLQGTRVLYALHL